MAKRIKAATEWAVKYDALKADVDSIGKRIAKLKASLAE